MAVSIGLLKHRTVRKMSVLAATCVAALAGPAVAQTGVPTPSPAQTACSYQGAQFMPAVINPSLEDRQLIMDLIHRYNWALDGGTTVGFDGLFTDDVSFELCSASHQQLWKLKNTTQLRQYFSAANTVVDMSRAQTRHFESNTLLNAIDSNTVQGKSTILVTIQFSGIETPVLDYTGIMHTVFKRSREGWQFSSILLVTDGPKIDVRAR